MKSIWKWKLHTYKEESHVQAHSIWLDIVSDSLRIKVRRASDVTRIQFSDRGLLPKLKVLAFISIQFATKVRPARMVRDPMRR